MTSDAIKALLNEALRLGLKLPERMVDGTYLAGVGEVTAPYQTVDSSPGAVWLGLLYAAEALGFELEFSPKSAGEGWVTVRDLQQGGARVAVHDGTPGGAAVAGLAAFVEVMTARLFGGPKEG